MANRRTALQLVERKSFGGSSYDSLGWASMFRTYRPANLGIKSAQLFSSELGSHIVNKKFTYYTVAKGNIYMLPGGVDDYEWSVIGDADVDFRITEVLVASNAQPGKGNTTFKIALDRDWLHEPVVIKGENANLPLLKVLGNAKQRSANSWEYEVELQTGDAAAWYPLSYLQPGMRFIRVSTSVSDELNTKYGGDSFGEMLKLQSWVGNFGNKAEFTDKFIRLEISAKEGKNPMPNTGYSVGGKSYKDSAIGVGYMYTQKLSTSGTNDKEVIEQGVFIPKIEARLRERTIMDREFNCEFGQLQKTIDRDSGRTIKVPSGWRQIVREQNVIKLAA